MTEETAKALAEAMNRLAETLEKAQAAGFGGLHIWHHGQLQQPATASPYQTWTQPVYWPLSPTSGGAL